MSSRHTVITNGLEYTINYDKEIGKGSFAQVCEGRTSAGRLVAVKYSSSKSGIDAALNEVDILTKLKNVPNIVQLIGSICQRDEYKSCTTSFSFAMEMASTSLEALMKRAENIRGLPMNSLIDLISDCAEAMNALKDNNIVHRDIKHMNILTFPASQKNGRRSSQIFKLCDLGAAKLFKTGENQCMNTLVGTPNMLHPHLAVELTRETSNWKTEQHYTSEECDLWSLGCTFFFCSTGSLPLPFSGADRNLYYRAALSLTRDPDAIGMNFNGCFKSNISNEKSYTFKPIIEIPNYNNIYPKWFVYTISSIIRALFHSPSIENLTRVSRKMRLAKQRTFMSIDQLQFVEHCDLSECPLIGFNFPSLADCFNYPPKSALLILSKKSQIILEDTLKSIKNLEEDDYLVVPMCEKVQTRQIPINDAIIRETRLMSTSNLIEARKSIIFNGLCFLDDAERFEKLFSNCSDILEFSYLSIKQQLIKEQDIISPVHRFAVYADVACMPMAFMTSKTNNLHQDVENCSRAAREARDEMEFHSNCIVTLINNCCEFIEDAKKLKLISADVPGIREEISSFNMTDNEDILATTEHVMRLNRMCLEARNSILRQIFDKDETGMNKLLRALAMAKNICDIKNRCDQFQNRVQDCAQILEMPFLEMKNVVNSSLKSIGIDENTFNRFSTLFSKDMFLEMEQLNLENQIISSLTEKIHSELQNILEKSEIDPNSEDYKNVEKKSDNERQTSSGSENREEDPGTSIQQQPTTILPTDNSTGFSTRLFQSLFVSTIKSADEYSIQNDDI